MKLEEVKYTIHKNSKKPLKPINREKIIIQIISKINSKVRSLCPKRL